MFGNFDALSEVSISQVLSVGLMLLGASISVTSKGTRRSVMGLWSGQLGAGALLLAAGAELVAVLLWISATVACGVYFLHADLFTEGDAEGLSRGVGRWAATVFPALISAAFGAMVYFLLSHAMEWSNRGLEAASQPQGPAPWKDERLIALELTALFLLAVTVGAGVISRAKRGSP